MSIPLPFFNRFSWLLDSLILFTAILLFYLLWLNAYPLFTPDEGRYAEVAREMLVSKNYLTPTENSIVFLDKPILFYWLETVALSLFGLKEWVVRLWPVICGTLGCLMTYAAGRFLFNRQTGVLAAILLATSPLYFGSAHYTNLDMELSTWITGALFSFIIGIQTTSKLRPYLLLSTYFFAALAFLTKGLIGVAFPALVGGMWIVLLKEWPLLKKSYLFFGCLLFLGLTVPWYYLANKANPGYLHYFFIDEQFSRFISQYEFNNKTPAWFFIPVLIAGFFPWSIFLIQSLFTTMITLIQKRSPTKLFLMLWFVIIFSFFSLPHSKLVTYILPVFPPLALLCSHYLNENWDKVKSNGIYFGIFNFFFFTACLIGGLLVLPHHHFITVTHNIFPTLMIMIGALIIGMIGCLLHFRFKNLTFLFIVLCISSVILLLTFIHSARELNIFSVKTFANELNLQLKPTDQVMTYFNYYEELPFYLRRSIHIVDNWQATEIIHRDNWKRELWRGEKFHLNQNILIEWTQFWKAWTSKKPIYLLVENKYLKDFKKTPHYILKQQNELTLMRNFR